ncbi:MAG: 2-oxoacid:acceptor oxidoreductase subunit alpha [Caldilinea sp.]|nr:2-oxoacid:acceptor oxidoreductase subunit alpha [Caldilineaceae bacterium]MCB9120259.1 2-oxoacid:acceptor oxidoreductase subunit alpha [Caldilineaceae bacterium]MCB9124091.1 2-oxoacid:acceptor oxidoreductase subunit alpha [Caldilineaceae bacterium]MCO5210525.1 2-oxoacid:acceptor oxidoreductase subunit alpha [Caldilinea sp.]
MSVIVQEPQSKAVSELIVNDFNINVATSNGSGSQTSNSMLIRSLYKMGIPVTGKNLFPSNIQGLPTWFNIRLSKDGFLARRERVEIMICMNGATVAEDMESVEAGGIVLYDDSLPIANHRKDVQYFPMPVKELVKAANLPYNLQRYVANMVYVGVAAYLLEIEMDQIKDALSWNFGGKTKPIELNWSMVTAAYDWATENLVNDQPYRVGRMTGFNEGTLLVDGNTAAAIGAVFGGFTFASWYPITPSSSIAESLSSYAAKVRRDPETKEATYAIVQAEDELAAIGMVLGAGWAGARAMTATSGPGISLMSEFVGYGYFAEIPAVIWDVQRMGPSTGLPTRTSQGDIMSTHYLGHGDGRHPVLFPADPTECFDMAIEAFDIAERLQTPVFVLSDLDIGMNLWITKEFSYPEKPLDRGKVLSAEQLAQFKDNHDGQRWGRYLDVDGDGIAYRTLPGTDNPSAAYFTRGTGHTAYATYTERPDIWEENLMRLQQKFNTARSLVPAPVVQEADGATIGIISVGSNHPAIIEALARLSEEGVAASYLRVRALPTNGAVKEFVAKYDKVYVIENNLDGQLHKILQTEFPESATKLVSLAKCDGLPLSARWITEQIAN